MSKDWSEEVAVENYTEILEKTLQLIAMTRVVEVDEVNTMKLRAVINSAQDALNWKKTT